MVQLSGATGGGMFSVREVEYLESLPAVERVRSGRIMYAEAFKQEAVRRYLDGESPAEIFRSAGLDSSLIGYKRIERSMARWRRTVQPASDKNRGGVSLCFCQLVWVVVCCGFDGRASLSPGVAGVVWGCCGWVVRRLGLCGVVVAGRGFRF